MIKLTDHQIKYFEEGLNQDRESIWKLNAIISSLSTDQLKQLCEAKCLSVVEWVEFDKCDIATWPRDNRRLLALDSDVGTVSARWGEIGWYLEGELDRHSEVTHWCELPQRKESKS